ncbi:amidohydrolase family protein [Niastella sp. OAS944]|uniref:amidohydrolase family protein n=1 Tax=Niastella sp. OAS944 TaxID=2664089 RepID=UPI00347A8064|nr:imidazolonepropionase-like amidohydrolase [Chitinophagaceae bacterium OAS944]
MRENCFFPPGKLLFLFGLMLLIQTATRAQVTFPVNGIADPQVKCFAFTNATIVKDVQTTLANATLVIREGKVVAVGTSVTIPKDAVVVDCSGKFIYPSFIDIYSDYGVAQPQRQGGGFDFRAPAQLTSNIKGVFGWNQAIKSDLDAAKLFNTDDAKAKPLRDIGFGTVLTHQKDGIARGTGALVTLATEKENLVMLKEKASAHYSFSKGTSTQSYPGSMMGSVALLRQTYLDAQWYRSNPTAEGVNLTLKAWNEVQSLPQIFEANDKWSDLRADRIGDEFGVQYIIKGGGNEYQRIKEIAATKATYILALNFPQAMDVEDPNEARFVSLADMKHWELAPTNLAAFEKANIPFCITAADVKDTKQFFTNLRKAIDKGLSEAKALEALTKTPATALGVYDKVGSLDAGKVASFIITNGEVFKEKTVILQNWVQGDKYSVKDENWAPVAGQYTLNVKGANGSNSYTLDVKSTSDASIIAKDTIKTKFSFDGKLVTISFATEKKPRAASIRLGGSVNGDTWNGNGIDADGNNLLWSATFSKAGTPAPDTTKKKPQGILGKVTYPFDGYGWDSLPQAETILIKNGTVWTNEKEGNLTNTDVLIKNGKIAQIGKNLPEAGAKVIDATGKFVTPGIIDEHSHIAAFSINEGAQSVTSEVRIADNLNPEDINIYRQLSGGVTSSHILHGSANTIGGQTQLIKLRWGVNDEELKFKGADPFIKFALGENVKRTTSQNNNRFPDTRMGVEEVMMDAFTRACEYEKGCKESEAATATPKKKGAATTTTTAAPVRRDLELDALVEIMNKKRFITCHSYVQSEITATMRVAEKFNFRVNTFTHILEGYKVADKMKTHGANASTFSDWWAYKTEVTDAIPYNASIMQRVGLNVCINSDDAEMARRLNQEAAKSVKYGGMSEEDAFKMVTLNPAKALHVDEKVGSLKAGKDADVVVWSDNPLSIYAKAEKTIVDGIVYFDRTRDLEMRKKISAERNRLVQKMLGEKRSGGPVGPATPSFQVVLSCGDHDHHDGLITIDVDENDASTR